MTVFVWTFDPDDGSDGANAMWTNIALRGGGCFCNECGAALQDGDGAMYWHFLGKDMIVLLHEECAAHIARGFTQDLSRCLPYIPRKVSRQ